MPSTAELRAAARVVHRRTAVIDGTRIFYREAGSPDAPALVLLHGFPTSSHMFRDLIPLVAHRFHVIAPDYPGYGFSDAPDPADFTYTFDHLSDVVERLIDHLGVRKATFYLQDFGGPIGFRIAVRRPELVEALVVQNAVAHVDGVSPALAPLQRYWQDPVANEAGARGMLAAATTRFQYEAGAADPSALAREAWTLDQALLDRPGNDRIQLALLLDYASNLGRFAEWQAYLRTFAPPTLVLWGANDPFFTPAGAEAFRRDLPAARVVLYEGGHFVLEEQATAIAGEILALQERIGRAPAELLWGIAHVEARDGKEAELEQALRHVVAETRKEPGNRHFDLYRGTAAPRRFFIHESWQDEGALQAHFVTAHVQELLGRLGDLAVAPLDLAVARPVDRVRD